MDTWDEVVAMVRAVVQEDVADGTLDPTDTDAVDTYAREWADGCSWVIYYGEAGRVWANGMPDFDDEADDLAEPGAGIRARVTLAAYLATVDLIERTCQELASVSADQ